MHQLLLYELGRVQDVRGPVHDPPPGAVAACPRHPLLQVAVLVHAAAADGEDDGLGEALPALAEAGARACCLATLARQTPRRDTAGASANAARRGHCASSIRGPGVEVEIVLRLRDGRAGRRRGIHDALHDLGDGEVSVGGEECLDAADERLEVR